MVAPSSRFVVSVFLVVMTVAVSPSEALTAAVDDDNITALKQLCEKFRDEHFDIVYDEYGWSLEKIRGIDDVEGAEGDNRSKPATDQDESLAMNTAIDPSVQNRSCF